MRKRERERWDTSDFWPIICFMMQTIIGLGGFGLFMWYLAEEARKIPPG